MHTIIYSKRWILAVAALFLSVGMKAQEEGDVSNIVDATHLHAYAMALLMIAITVLLFYNRLIVYREKELVGKNRNQSRQVGEAFKACGMRVWFYDVRIEQYCRLSEAGQIEAELTPITFAGFFDRSDFDNMSEHMKDVFYGKRQQSTVLMHGNIAGEKTGQQQVYELSMEVFERDPETDKPLNIILLLHDITEELEQQKNATNLLMQYHTVFNLSVIDMVYYDEEGKMNDINPAACKMFGIADRESALKVGNKLANIPCMAGIDIKTMDTIWATSITKFQDIDSPFGEIDCDNWNNTIYYEQLVSPQRDASGQLKGFVLAGRNVSEMVGAHHKQRLSAERLMQATADVQEYISNINYSLQISGVQLMNYYPDTHILEVSNGLGKPQLQLTQLRCVELVVHHQRPRARGLLRRMDQRKPSHFYEKMQVLLRDKQGRNLWLMFSIIPMLNPDGTVDHYFGMCRDITDMVETEAQLQTETEKAREAEQVKNSFLLNMSHEIRTPLNAVLGFAEQFNTEHDQEDEAFFAEQIKDNANSLLELVNDILFLSRLDAHMVEKHSIECDFATVFDGYCTMGFGSVAPGVKVILENTYNHLMIEIDESNLATAIHRICANATYYTTEGFVRAKYEYRLGRLAITIEDSGRGISAEQLPKVFNRHISDDRGERCGSGLGLAIAKELVEQMGGAIDLQSEEGKGTSVWISIPCTATLIDRKDALTDRLPGNEYADE